MVQPLYQKRFLKRFEQFFHHFLFSNYVCSLVFCIEIEQWDVGCNETDLNIVAKVQNVSCGERNKKKKVK